MPPPTRKANYDYGAASRLQVALDDLITRLNGLITARSESRNTLLGNRPNDKWQGDKRNTFDDAWGREQADFQDLIRWVRKMQSEVREETAKAARHDIAFGEAQPKPKP